MIPPQSLVWRQTYGFDIVCFLGNQWLFGRYSMPLDSVPLYWSGLKRGQSISWPSDRFLILSYLENGWIFIPKLNMSSFDGSKLTTGNGQKPVHLPQPLMWNLTTWEWKSGLQMSSHSVPQLLPDRNKQVKHQQFLLHHNSFQWGIKFG